VKTYDPLPLVGWLFLTPVAALAMVTFALGTTAPVLSLTVPVRVPRPLWAQTAVLKSDAKAKRKTTVRNRTFLVENCIG
jgi:hypothetical protein